MLLVLRLLLFHRGLRGGQRAAILRLFWVREDHTSRNGLEHARHRDLNRHIHVLPPVLDHDHRTVIEIADTLAEFLAILHDLDVDIFAGQQHWFDRISQFVDVEDLAIHVADTLDLGINNLDGHGGIFLQAIEDLQAAPAPIAAHRIGGIGDALEFVQHKARDDQSARDEAGLADVGDASIDDRAGVEQDLGNGLHMDALAVLVTLIGAFASIALLPSVALTVFIAVTVTVTITPAARHRRLKEMRDIAFTQHSDGHTEIAKENGADKGKHMPHRLWQAVERYGEQRRNDKSDGQADGRRDEIAGGGSMNFVTEPDIGFDGDVWRNDECEDTHDHSHGDGPLPCNALWERMIEQIDPDDNADSNKSPDDAGNSIRKHPCILQSSAQPGCRSTQRAA